MTKRKIIELCLIITGLGALTGFSLYTSSVLAEIGLVALGLILSFTNRREEI
jgi:small-conductance mechanosensitive channel